MLFLAPPGYDRDLHIRKKEQKCPSKYLPFGWVCQLGKQAQLANTCWLLNSKYFISALAFSIHITSF
jgi:hypothetical protein